MFGERGGGGGGGRRWEEGVGDQGVAPGVVASILSDSGFAHCTGYKK